jgi:putative DNA primase/helicase
LTEISPSGTGAKIFLVVAAEDIAPIRAAMGMPHGREWKRPGNDHPPAIEWHVSNRYFTTTEEHVPGPPDRIAMVGLDTVLWLIKEAGPAFVGETKAKGKSNGQDQSSAKAFREGARLRREGKSFEEFVEALRNHADPDRMRDR